MLKIAYEWRLDVLYDQNHGWKHEATEVDRAEILAKEREYRANCPQYPVRIGRHKVRQEED